MPRRDDLVHRATMLAERMYGKTNLLHNGGPVILSSFRVALMVAIHPWGNPERVAATLLAGSLDLAGIRNGPAAVACAKTRIRTRLGVQVANMVQTLSAPAAIDQIPGKTEEEMEARNFAHFAASPPWVQRVRVMMEMDAVRQMAPAADADTRLEMSRALDRFRLAVAGTLGDTDLDADASEAIAEVATSAQAELDEMAGTPPA